MQLQGERFARAVHSVNFTKPNYIHEGLNGYLETKVTYTIDNLAEFSKLHYESYSTEKALDLYGLLKKIGCE
jgi:hypothetical protein